MTQHIMRMDELHPLTGMSVPSVMSVDTLCGPEVLTSEMGMKTRRCVMLTINGESMLLNAAQVKHLSVLFGELSE